MAATSYSTNPRVSTLAYNLREGRSLSNPSKYSSDFQSTNTHNNNQPFSYTKNPREIIYAHVVSGDKDRGGHSSKRTVHSKFVNSSYDDTATPSSISSPTINHFVYETNKENRYKDSVYSNYMDEPKHVTTVLLNSSDEDYGYKPTPHSYLSKPERTFIYGNSTRNVTNSLQNLSSSSREVSPAPISAKLVRDADRRRNPSGTYYAHAPQHKTSTHTHYNYMNEKLGYMTPSEYSDTGHGTRGRSYDSSIRYYDTNTLKRGTTASKGTDYKNTASKTNGISTTEYRTSNNKLHSPSSNNNMSYTSLERKQNKKNGEYIKPVPQTKAPSGGFISTLMRRNKDKKVGGAPVGRDETGTGPNPAPNPKEKDVKPVKKQRKFLAGLFKENFGRKTTTMEKEGNRAKKSSPAGTKVMTTDSEIEEAERRRDGEYHVSLLFSFHGKFHLLAVWCKFFKMVCFKINISNLYSESYLLHVAKVSTDTYTSTV